MKRLLALFVFAVPLAAQQTTPNLGLIIQTPPQYPNNWGAIVNYDLNKIDASAALTLYQGAWSNTVTYTKSMMVTYSGVLYVSALNGNLNNTPGSSGAWVATGGGSPIVFANTNGVVYNTSQSTSRNATYSDLVALFAGGSCSGFLKNDGTCSTPAAGLADPGSNGVIKRTALNTTAPATYADIVALFAGGSCSGYIKSDGTCSTPSGAAPGGSTNATQYNAGGGTFGGVGPGTSGQVLTSQGPSSPPSFQTNSSVQYPANGTTALLIGSSLNGDDNHNFSNSITITGGSASGGVCTFTNSGTNGLSAGDWVWTGSVTGWPAQGAAYNSYTYGTGTVNDQQFQVSATGLSPSGFQVSCPNAGTATFTGGNVYTSNYWFSHRLEQMPYINGHITLSLILTGAPPTCAAINTNFATVVPNVSGHTAYLFITDCHNDFNSGSSAASVETAVQSIWNKAHTAGYTVIMATTPNAQITGLNPGSYSFQANLFNWWLMGQAKQNGNAAGKQYWDYLVNFDLGGGPYNLNSGNNLGTSAGNQMSAYIANSVFATGGTTPTTVLPYMYYGWVTGIIPNNSGPGINIANSAVDAWTVCDGTQTNCGIRVDTTGTPGARIPTATIATNLLLSFLGSNTSPLCTTTSGAVTNIGCAGMTSISSPDTSIDISTPAGTPKLKLSLDNSYQWANTQNFNAPTTTSPSAVFQATSVTRPTIVQATSGYNGHATWTTTAGHAIVTLCQGNGTLGSDSSSDTFHVVQATTNMTMSYAYNIAGGVGVTLQCAGGVGFNVYELANVPTTAFLDVATGPAVTSSPQTVSVTTTQSNDLLISAIVSVAGLSSVAVDGTWTNGMNGNQGEIYSVQNATLAGSAGSYGVTWTYSGATYNNIIVAAFKGATASQSSDIVSYKNASSITVSKINSNGLPQSVAGTFSTLPTCNSGLEGTRAAVTDSTVTTGTITGGGTNHVPAYCNGSNWVVD